MVDTDDMVVESLFLPLLPLELKRLTKVYAMKLNTPPKLSNTATKFICNNFEK